MAPTNAKSREQAYSHVFIRNKTNRQRVRSRESGSQETILGLEWKNITEMNSIFKILYFTIIAQKGRKASTSQKTNIIRAGDM